MVSTSLKNKTLMLIQHGIANATTSDGFCWHFCL
jgi:hypothetical protein